MRILLIVFAVTQILLGLLLWLTPGFFYDEIGPYGPRNDHYMADLATFYIALGAVALVALRRTPWRVPVLAVAAAEYLLHSLNHLIDVGEAHPSWLGPANLALVAASTVLVGWMLRREQREAAR
jgi:divalent metal cation (Fe/Co/Zn/Cd) transporter